MKRCVFVKSMVLFKMMIRLDNAKEYLIHLVKKPGFYFCLILTTVNAFFTKQALESNGVGQFGWVLLVELLIEGLMIALLLVARNKKWPVEKKFLILAIGLGVLFMIFLPPGQAPDDINHFRRAYAISDGVFIAERISEESEASGSVLPIEVSDFDSRPSKGTYGEITQELMKGVSGEASAQSYTNTALYSFVCYIPQTLAALLGKMFNMSIMGIAYLMEIFNFAVWVVLIYFAIKLIPKFKTVLLFVALLPITLQEATSMAPDALTIGLSALLVSYVLYLAYECKRIMTNKDLVLLYVIALVIGFCKIVYLPLILLYVIIPSERFGTKKRKAIHLSSLAVVVIGLNLLWLAISAGTLMEFNPGVDSKMQLMGILNNPIGYLITIVRSIGANFQFWLYGALGMLLGSWAFDLPMIMGYVSFAMAVLLFAQRDEALKLRKIDRGVFVFVFVTIVLLIFTSLYIQWTAVGAAVIDGVQGRYFLPILLLIPIMVCRVKTRPSRATLVSESAVLYYSLYINVLACVLFFAQNI